MPILLPATFRLLLLASAQASAPSPAYQCDEPRWESQPRMSEGHFSGTLSMRCRLELQEPSGIRRLSRSYEKEMTEERTQNRAPRTESQDGLEGHRYDTTHRFRQDGDDITLREDVFVGSNDKEFRMESRSREIQASGVASYLRDLDFSSSVVRRERRGDGSALYDVTVENRVRIQRPWYALSPIFFAIARSKTRSKFERVADSFVLELMERMEPAEEPR